MRLISDPRVKNKFETYPDNVRDRMLTLRSLIIEVAKEIEGLEQLEETLKWGEPSYLTKKGSTLRMDWKAKSAMNYALYFKCTSRLVETFKLCFEDYFEFEGNRAIVFGLNDILPEKELKICIRTTLTYHQVKALSRLGI